MLDSDIPNPDSRLYVEFYSRPVQNMFLSQQEGRPIFEDCDFVKIFVPGDSTTVIDTPANDTHKARFPLHWQHYQNKHEGSQQTGTQLSAWPVLTAAQVEELRAIKFYTVESIATASDAQLQRIGMIAGMSPYAFRERAQRFLKAAADDGYLNQQADAVKRLEAERETMQQQMERMQAMIEELAANQKAKPGRKPQNAQPDDEGHSDAA